MHNITIQNRIWIPRPAPQRHIIFTDPRAGLRPLDKYWHEMGIAPLDAAGINPHGMALVQGREQLKTASPMAAHFELLPAYAEAGLIATFMYWRMTEDSRPMLLLQNPTPWVCKLWGGAHIGNILLIEDGEEANAPT